MVSTTKLQDLLQAQGNSSASGSSGWALGSRLINTKDIQRMGCFCFAYKREPQIGSFNMLCSDSPVSQFFPTPPFLFHHLENTPEQNKQKQHKEIHLYTRTHKTNKTTKSETIPLEKKIKVKNDKQSNIRQKKNLKIQLSSYFVGHQLLGMGSDSVVCTPGRWLCRNSFFFVSGYQLEIASW